VVVVVVVVVEVVHQGDLPLTDRLLLLFCML